MYEQYTDKQIVEMLVPKLKKTIPELNWDEYLNRPDAFSIWNRLISVIYKSAYIRGQLGRSFIIGEKKTKEPVNTFADNGVWACKNKYLEKVTEHWVPATETNLKPGVKVRYLNAKKHLESPEYYPAQGTVGDVVSVCNDNTCFVQWSGYTATWYARWSDLEVLLCE